MELNQLNTLSIEQDFDKFLSGKAPKPLGDHFLRIHISRNTFLAVLFSLLIHIVIFFFAPKFDFDTPATQPATTIEVSLARPEMPAPSASVEIEPIPEVLPEKPAKLSKPAKEIKRETESKSAVKPSFDLPDVIATTKPSPEKVPINEPAVEEQFADMASYVKAMQARRKGAEYDAARQNAEAVAREKGPSEEQIRDERIKRNFQNGTNGIFEITSLGARHATFAFRGWVNDYSASKRQFFEVDAQPGQDVRLVMIRRMIALIREHYQGDFTWQSHRLGFSVTQSARLEDNAGLEDFLMMEFFGSNYKSSS